MFNRKLKQQVDWFEHRINDLQLQIYRLQQQVDNVPNLISDIYEKQKRLDKFLWMKPLTTVYLHRIHYIRFFAHDENVDEFTPLKFVRLNDDKENATVLDEKLNIVVDVPIRCIALNKPEEQ